MATGKVAVPNDSQGSPDYLYGEGSQPEIADDSLPSDNQSVAKTHQQEKDKVSYELTGQEVDDKEFGPETEDKENQHPGGDSHDGGKEDDLDGESVGDGEEEEEYIDEYDDEYYGTDIEEEYNEYLEDDEYDIFEDEENYNSRAWGDEYDEWLTTSDGDDYQDLQASWEIHRSQKW